MTLQRAVFLDRDGVINVNRADNVRSWEQFVFEKDSLRALGRLGKTEYRVIVITNQSGIGLGQMTRETVDEIHARLCEMVAGQGGLIDRVYACPHRKDENCTCRKPSPEMLLRGRDEFQLDMQGSFFIGDWVDDVRAARRAGVRPILVRTGRGERAIAEMKEQGIPLPEIFENLSEAVEWILTRQVESTPDPQKN